MSEDLAVLKNELADLAKTMRPNHLMVAKGLIANKSQEQAYIDAGYNSKKPAVDASKTISKYPSIVQYKELFLKIVHLESLPKEIATFEQKKELLWNIAIKSSMLKLEVKGSENSETGAPALEIFDAAAAKTAVSAVTELNKMEGHHKPTVIHNKHEFLDSFLDELGL
jgi:hypothetical protein